MVGADYKCTHEVYLNEDTVVEVEALWHYEPDDPICPGGWTLEETSTEYDLSKKEDADKIWAAVERDGPLESKQLIDYRDYDDYDDFDYGDERL